MFSNIHVLYIYNWKELNTEYALGAKDAAELVSLLMEKKGITKLNEVLDELDGIYAFTYESGNHVYACRDVLGVAPLWYSTKDGFTSAPERKDILNKGLEAEDVKELDPRTILNYNIKTGKAELLRRDFFSIIPEHRKSEDELIRELTGLVINAVSKRLPDEKAGILFSGGIDSTLIAQICQKLGVPFVCYTAALECGGMKEAEDLVYAKKVAERLNFPLKTKVIKLYEAEKRLKELVPLIEDSNVVKVGVGLTFHVACELARKDGIKFIFSGLGSEEIFAGYERHIKSGDLNKECLAGLLRMHERDTYRDHTITAHYGMQLLVPFLDKNLVGYSLKIPAEHKIAGGQNKVIIRKVAEGLGVPKEFAQRKKRAAQYGSNFDKAIDKLAKKAGLKSKSAYLDRFYSRNPSLGAMFSSGKDSAYALWVMQKQNYPIRCMITMKSRNPDSYMFHTPNIDLASLQAKAMQIPIIFQETAGVKEEELLDMKKAIERAKKEYCIEGVVTGALYSQYQRERIEKICYSLGMKVFSPLWHMDQEKEMRQLVAEGFEVVLSSIAAEGLDRKWLGRKINAKDIDNLVKLKKKIGINIAGEGGEFESLVLDGPMFRQRIDVVDSEIVEESENVARFVVKKAKLVKK